MDVCTYISLFPYNIPCPGNFQRLRLQQRIFANASIRFLFALFTVSCIEPFIFFIFLKKKLMINYRTLYRPNKYHFLNIEQFASKHSDDIFSDYFEMIEVIFILFYVRIQIV